MLRKMEEMGGGIVSLHLNLFHVCYCSFLLFTEIETLCKPLLFYPFHYA